MKKIEVGIIGAAGYTAGELIRILINHPACKIAYCQSESQSGKMLSSVHEDLIGETKMCFTDEMSAEVDVIFLCKGHGASEKILSQNPELLKTRIIDLSQDFRLAGAHDFVYGLPELARTNVQSALHVANPGCFATCIQLGLLPAFAAGFASSDVHISGITGSTGAGQSFSATSHFSWRSNNASAYKVLNHQHMLEVGETLQGLSPQFAGQINFVPYRGAFSRGIITTSYFEFSGSEEELLSSYKGYYNSAPFTHVVDKNPDLKMVVNTNKAVVFPSITHGKAVVVSVIDNLLKGASGQAVQNLNLMFGLDETAGLNLKPSAH